MLKKRIIIVATVIVILFNFLPLNICYAGSVTAAPTSEITGTPTTTSEKDNDMSNLVYEGLSKPVGILENETSWFERLIKTLQGILDFITGAITMVLRIPFVGFATWEEKIISGTLQSVSDGNSPELVTIEDIVYNRVPIFDINVFNVEDVPADGTGMSDQTSVVDLLKIMVARWYVAIRNLVIVILLAILVYLGIRMAITSIAEEKARYKQMLVDWFVSFFIVFFLHYFIYIVLKFNDVFIATLRSSNKINSFYQMVRDQSHAVSFDTGWLATFMYLALVILMAKYVWKYANRLISMYILIIFTPVVAVSYALDKIKDNRSQALGKWMKEITYTVLIQSAHALLYTVFIVEIIGDTLGNDFGSSIGKIIFLIIALGFISEIEKIIGTVFGFKASSTVSEVMQSTLDAMAKFKIAKGWLRTGTKIAREPLRFGRKFLGWAGGGIHKNVVTPIGNKVPRIGKWDQGYNNFKDSVKTAYEAGRNGVSRQEYAALPKEDRERINTARKKQEAEDFGAAKNAFKTAFKIPSNMIGGMAMLIDNPWAGSSKLIAAITSGVAFGGITKKQIKRYKILRHNRLRSKRGNTRGRIYGLSRLNNHKLRLKNTAAYVLGKPNIITGDRTFPGADREYLRAVEQATKQVDDGMMTASVIQEMMRRSDSIMQGRLEQSKANAVLANELQGLQQRMTSDGLAALITNAGQKQEGINLPADYDMKLRFALADKIFADASMSRETLSQKYGQNLASEIDTALKATKQAKGFRKLSADEKTMALQEATKTAIYTYLTKDKANVNGVLNALNIQEVTGIATAISTGGQLALDKTALTDQIVSDVGLGKKETSAKYGRELGTVILQARLSAEKEIGFKNLSGQEQIERKKELTRAAVTQFLTSGQDEKVISSLNKQVAANVTIFTPTEKNFRTVDGSIILDAARRVEQRDSSIRVNEALLGKNMETVLAESLASSYMKRDSSLSLTIDSPERIRFSKAIRDLEAQDGFKQLNKKEQEARRYEVVEKAAREYVRDEKNRDRVIGRMDVDTSTRFATLAINREGSIERDYSFIYGREVVSLRTAESVTRDVLSGEGATIRPTMDTLKQVGNESARLSDIKFEPTAFKEGVIKTLADEIANGYMGNETAIDIPIRGKLGESIQKAVDGVKSEADYSSKPEAEQEELVRASVIAAARTHLKNSNNLDRTIERIDERLIPSIVMRASNTGRGVDLQSEHSVNIQSAEQAAETILRPAAADYKPDIETVTRIGNETATLANVRFSEHSFRDGFVGSLSEEIADGYMGKRASTAVRIDEDLKAKIDDAVRREQAKPEFMAASSIDKEKAIRKAVIKTTKEELKDTSRLDRTIGSIEEKELPRLVMRASNPERVVERNVSMESAQKAVDSIMTPEKAVYKPNIETVTRMGSQTAQNEKVEFNEDAFRESFVETVSRGIADRYVGEKDAIDVPIVEEVKKKIDEAVQSRRGTIEFIRAPEEEQKRVIKEIVEDTARESLRTTENLDRTIERIDKKEMPTLIVRASNPDLAEERNIDIEKAQEAASTVLEAEKSEPKPTIESMTRIGDRTASLSHIPFNEDTFRESLVSEVSSEIARGYMGGKGEEVVPISKELRTQIDDAVTLEKEKYEFETFSPPKQEKVIRETIMRVTRENLSDTDTLNRTVGRISSKNVPRIVMRASNAGIPRTRISDAQMIETERFAPILRQAINLRRSAIEASGMKTRPASQIAKEILEEHNKK